MEAGLVIWIFVVGVVVNVVSAGGAAWIGVRIRLNGVREDVSELKRDMRNCQQDVATVQTDVAYIKGKMGR